MSAFSESVIGSRWRSRKSSQLYELSQLRVGGDGGAVGLRTVDESKGTGKAGVAPWAGPLVWVDWVRFANFWDREV